MKRRFAGAAVAMALVALTAGAPVASAACPNEAFRTGPSALLAECRAYEMVTPVDKESGVGIWEFGGAHADPNGNGIYFNSSSAYAGARSNVLNNPFVATRGGDGWDTDSIGSPQAVQGFAIGYTTAAVSDDLHYSLTASKEALTPDAVPFGSNLYVRDNRTGTYTLVLGLPGNQDFANWTLPGHPEPPFVAASVDFGAVVISRPDGLYEFREGTLRLAAAGGRRAADTEVVPNQMSADGSRFFYLTSDGSLYMHRLGAEPVRISAENEGIAPEARLVGATPSGEVAFFFEHGRLYRFEASAPAGRQVTELTPPAEPEGPQVTAALVGDEDPDTVYFAAASVLTPDAAPVPGPEAPDLYVWHGDPGQDGGIRYIAPAAGVTGISPDGRFAAFESVEPLTPDVTEGSSANCSGGRCTNVFLYSYDADRLGCASCSGAAPVGDSRVGASSYLRLRYENGTVSQAVLDDGTVFIDSPNALVPRDANGVLDTYSRREGETQLISSGNDPAPSFFVGASADGSDVYFATQEPLVGQDSGTVADVYDARVDGGLPQGGPVSVPPCIDGNACRSATPPSGSLPSSGSETTHDDAKVAGACGDLRSKAVAARKRARLLGRRGRQASGARAKALRKRSQGEAKAARRLARRAGACRGIGR